MQNKMVIDMLIRFRFSVIQILFVILAVLAFCFASPGVSYVLSGAQILDQMQKKLGKAKKIQINQKLVIYDSHIEGGIVQLDETVKYYFPDKFRSDIISENTKKIHLASFDQVLIVLDGNVASEYESGFDHYKDILLFRNRIMIEQRLSFLGLDIGETSLERYGDRIVFVIGKKNGRDNLSPMLYVDKETFLPVRWVLGTAIAGEQAESLEVFYFDWKKFKKSTIPGRIEFYSNGKLVREITVKDVTVNPEFEDALFDFQAIKERCASSENIDAVDSGDSDENEARKTIDGLDKIIEKDQLAF